MEIRSIKKTRRFPAAIYFTVLVVFLSALVVAGPVFAKTAKEIDAGSDAALDRFYAQVQDGKQLAARAQGLLILPGVIKGGLILGAEYGEGALRIGGKTVDYYNIISGSIGFQIGGQAVDIIIAFNSETALKNFRASSGWEAGVDGNVALITVGGGERASFSNANEPIVAYVFDTKGLIFDISIKGAKFNKLDR